MYKNVNCCNMHYLECSQRIHKNIVKIIFLLPYENSVMAKKMKITVKFYSKKLTSYIYAQQFFLEILDSQVTKTSPCHLQCI